MTLTGHELDAVDPDEATQVLEAQWQSLLESPTGTIVYANLLECMEPEQRRSFLRGKRSEITMLKVSSVKGSPASRSTAYEEIKLLQIAVVLHHELGLIDLDAGFRDRRSNRKVKTILRELARIDHGDLDDPENLNVLAQNYEALRDEDLPEVRRLVRLVQTLDVTP